MEFKIDSITETAISEARDIMESFDPSSAMTVGFDSPTYIMTAEQMTKIAGALYLADCLIYELKKEGQ
jgi:hypothetical protein